MIIKQDFLPKGHPGRPGLLLSHATSVTVHWIGAFPKQRPEDTLNWWLKGSDGKGVEASAHYIIKDDRCLQAIPDGEVAWHCGSKGNYSSIGIEVIPMNNDGEFSLSTIETLKELILRLNIKELRRHYDWTGKDCPKYYTPLANGINNNGRTSNPEEGNRRWDELKKQIQI